MKRRDSSGVGRNPCTVLKSMPEKLFMVYLTGAEDPLDSAYRQRVFASTVEVSEDSLSFFSADGTLAAFLTDQLFTVGAK